MYSGGPLHRNEQRLGDQLELIHSSSVSIQDVAWESSREQWTIDGERGSGRSMLAAWHDDDVSPPWYCVLIHHTPSFIMLTNQNFIFFVMQWLFLSKNHHHTHTHMNKKKFFLLSQTVVTFATHHDTYIQETISNLLCSSCIFIHTHTHITYTTTQNNRQIWSTHTHTQRVVHNPNILLTVFFNFSAWWLSL